MDKLFQIGDFIFRLCCPAEVTPPENFMKFESGSRVSGQRESGQVEEFGAVKAPEYTYHIEVSDHLPEPDGKIVARRPDLLVFQRQAEGGGQLLESRLIGVKGRPDPYACYRETSANRAEILLMQDELRDLHIDPLFTSLLALERRLVRKDQMVLHCAYVEYRGEAILFSAPSETGKTTQAGLWEKYRGSRTVNGDRSLLGKKAFPLLYSQITVNKWNMQDHLHTMDLIEDFLGSVPVIHLGCTISEEAVECLEEALQSLDA